MFAVDVVLALWKKERFVAFCWFCRDGYLVFVSKPIEILFRRAGCDVSLQENRGLGVTKGSVVWGKSCRKSLCYTKRASACSGEPRWGDGCSLVFSVSFTAFFLFLFFFPF